MLNTEEKNNEAGAEVTAAEPQNLSAEQLAPAVPEPQNLAEEVERLKKELEEARQKAEENWEMFLRARADFDNYRKRLEAEAARRAVQAQADIILKLLDVRDNLERALAVPDDAGVATLKKGVQMVAKQFDMVLELEGLKPVESVGCRFDPGVHEAVEVVSDSGQEEGTVIEEVQRGYTFKGQLLRAARVKVAGKSDQGEVEQHN